MTKKQNDIKNEEKQNNQEENREADSTLQKRIEELEDQVKQTLADFQNREKRITEERQEWVKTASKDLILRLLPVVDTLQLAQAHDESEGLKLATQQFLDVLRAEGVERIKTEGEQFDPILMECVQTVDGEEGKVISEIRSGYMLNDKVLRPALVKVGKETN